MLAGHGVTEIAVFGSVARGEDDEGSDLDLLVTLPAGLSLFDLADIREEAENVIGTDVDLVSRESLRPDMFQMHRLVLDEAIPA
jgi:predicted nucleotidyltransferase